MNRLGRTNIAFRKLICMVVRLPVSGRGTPPTGARRDSDALTVRVACRVTDRLGRPGVRPVRGAWPGRGAGPRGRRAGPPPCRRRSRPRWPARSRSGCRSPATVEPCMATSPGPPRVRTRPSSVAVVRSMRTRPPASPPAASTPSSVSRAREASSAAPPQARSSLARQHQATAQDLDAVAQHAALLDGAGDGEVAWPPPRRPGSERPLGPGLPDDHLDEPGRPAGDADAGLDGRAGHHRPLEGQVAAQAAHPGQGAAGGQVAAAAPCRWRGAGRTRPRA